jgi:hypothetical protein
MIYPEFYIQYEEVRTLSFAEFRSRLHDTMKKPVGEVTIRDLSSTPSANGLYFMFYSEGTLAYIGKASSRSFIERIPAHFDQREEAWMNTVPKRILKKENADNYFTALQRAFELELVLFGFGDRKLSIKLESPLCSFLAPRLNRGKIKMESNQRLCEFETK